MVDIVGFANSAPTPTSLLYNGRMLRQMNGVKMAGATAARPLGSRSGVRPGTSVTTVTATSTTWTCGPHAGHADVMVAAEAGGYDFSFDGIASGPVTAASASFPRRDVVYDQIIDPENGTTTPSAVRGYLAGTVNSGGTLVIAAVPAGAFVVAEINVPISGGGAPTVTFVAPYTVAAGAILPVAAGAAPAGAFVGQYVDDAVLGLQRWNGSAWVSPAAPPHAEFTIAITGMTDNTPFANLAFTPDPASTIGAPFVTITSSAMVFAAGIYAISIIGKSDVLFTGRAALYLSVAGTIIASRSSFAGENILDVTLPNFYTSGSSTVNLSIIKTTGGSSNMSGRVRITKLR